MLYIERKITAQLSTRSRDLKVGGWVKNWNILRYNYFLYFILFRFC